MNVVIDCVKSNNPHICPCCGTENRVGIGGVGREIQWYFSTESAVRTTDVKLGRSFSCSTILKATKMNMPVPLLIKPGLSADSRVERSS